MKLILDIRQEADIQMLLRLLERLRIPYRKLGNMTADAEIETPKPDANNNNGNNYDAKEVEVLLEKIQQKQVFKNIADPASWQTQLRNEWE